MYDLQEGRAKFNGCREAQGLHDEVYTDGSKMNEGVGAAVVITRHFQNSETTCRQQQRHLCSWGYSLHSDTELLSIPGPSSSCCSILLWLNVLFAGNLGWRHRESFYLPYHEPALVIEWQGHTYPLMVATKWLWNWGKWKSGPTNKRDPWPWHRPSVHYTDLKPLVNFYIQQLVKPSGM